MQHDAFKEYDREVAQPRHEEVLESVGTVKSDMAELRGEANQLKGAINAGVKFVAIPSAILSALGILKVIVALVKGRF